MKKFRAVIQFNLDVALEGESADAIARKLHEGMVDLLKSLGAETNVSEEGILMMQGRVDPIASESNNSHPPGLTN